MWGVGVREAELAGKERGARRSGGGAGRGGEESGERRARGGKVGTEWRSGRSAETNRRALAWRRGTADPCRAAGGSQDPSRSPASGVLSRRESELRATREWRRRARWSL